jgi:hypothetical protein
MVLAACRTAQVAQDIVENTDVRVAIGVQSATDTDITSELGDVYETAIRAGLQTLVNELVEGSSFTEALESASARMAEVAISQGGISAGNPLLIPRFFVAYRQGLTGAETLNDLMSTPESLSFQESAPRPGDACSCSSPGNRSAGSRIGQTIRAFLP